MAVFRLQVGNHRSKEVDNTRRVQLHLFKKNVQVRLQVNIQDFLQVFQDSGIGKMEDNFTSADPLSLYNYDNDPG